jgi:hypothetical protein
MNKEDIEFLKGNGFNSIDVAFGETKNCNSRVKKLSISLDKTKELYSEHLLDRDGFYQDVVNKAIEKIEDYIKAPENKELEIEAEIAVGYLLDLNNSLL